jgi:hypothetical protein
MRKENIKAFLSTPRGKLVASCSALVICWIIVLPMIFGDFFSSGVSGGDISSLELELKKAKKAYEEQLDKKSKAETIRKKYTRLSERAWHEEAGGMIEVDMRQMVYDAAEKVEDFKLATVGSVRRVNINDELYCGEIDVTASDHLDKIVAFVEAVDKSDPDLSWSKLDLRPDLNFRRREQNTKTVVNLAEITKPKPTKILFSGTLQMIATKSKNENVSAVVPEKPAVEENKPAAAEADAAADNEAEQKNAAEAEVLQANPEENKPEAGNVVPERRRRPAGPPRPGMRRFGGERRRPAPGSNRVGDMAQ